MIYSTDCVLVITDIAVIAGHLLKQNKIKMPDRDELHNTILRIANEFVHHYGSKPNHYRTLIADYAESQLLNHYTI